MIRFTYFFLTMIIMHGLETVLPRDKVQTSYKRFFSNLALTFIYSFIFLFIPLTLLGLTKLIDEHNIGLFNQFDMNPWLEILITMVIFDCIIYWQHRLFHEINFFWKFHKVHHTDHLLDTSTALRFHPVELLFSFIIKAIAIIILGASFGSIFIFEIVLSSMAIFNHSNLQLHYSIDRILRRFIVTPDFHKFHHSVVSEEQNSNYGFNLSIWDKLFGSLCTKTNVKLIKLGTEDIKENLDLKELLKLPFKKL